MLALVCKLGAHWQLRIPWVWTWANLWGTSVSCCKISSDKVL